MTKGFVVRALHLWAALVLCGIAGVCPADSDWWSDANLTRQLWISIQKFTGNASGGYFEPNDSLASQISEGLGGPPDPAKQLTDGSRLLSATRFHSGNEHAAVVIDSNINVISAALISYGCHYTVPAANAASESRGGSSPKSGKPVSCWHEPRLTIIKRGAISDPVREAFVAWARSYSADIQCEERVLGGAEDKVVKECASEDGKAQEKQ